MKKIITTIIVALMCCNLYSQKEITLSDIWQTGTFRPKYISEIRPLSNGDYYCILTKDGIEKYEYKTGKKVGFLVDFSTLHFDKNTYITDYSISNDNTKILLAANSQEIYRHSFLADYYVYNLKDKSIIALSKDKIRLAEFSPKGDKVAFVRDNNLFISDLTSMTETQITKDGKYNHIINGTTDWVYEEEFAITKGFFWNNDGNKIAFYRFDQSNVKEYDMTMFPQDSLYPTHYKYKYPKAGEDNSVVDIYIYNLEDKTTKHVDMGIDHDIYLPRMQWTKGDNQLCITRLNRHQNEYELYVVNANTLEMKKVYKEVDECYIEQPDFVNFLNDKENLILKSERNGFMNLYKININNRSITPITNNNYDIDNICYIDEKEKSIYFTAAASKPYNRELMKVDFDGKKQVKLSKEEGTYTADFSTNGKYYISSFSNTDTPTIYTINNNKGNVVVTLEDNKELKNVLNSYSPARKEFSSFKTSLGDSLYYWIIKPTNMEKGKKYPLLFYVYGGPGSQEVLNSQSRFSDYMWFRMLAQKGYVIACVDNRGTGFRGSKFKKCTYMDLGNKETQDQFEAAQYFGNLDFIDKDRIGIFGWSYGGYMSSLCITKGHKYYKTAIAVAPVTNWRNYDNVYTERFMRTPQENADGYDKNSPINFVDDLTGNFLLIHGTADDNVHYQNTMNLTTALIKANKQFSQFSYPNKNHGIYGGNTRFHLYTMMTNFLLKNL
ncbi:MAG: S9 family peptidase [Bacteroidales bacterium]|jgi:dipeptidyl-peptidase-4|nr:S9 family peptidase [Bacteroidales bacterium]